MKTHVSYQTLCFSSELILKAQKNRPTIHDRAQHGGQQKRFACRVINLRPVFKTVELWRLGCVFVNHVGERTVST
jgi:hypothetical protein